MLIRVNRTVGTEQQFLIPDRPRAQKELVLAMQAAKADRRQPSRWRAAANSVGCSYRPLNLTQEVDFVNSELSYHSYRRLL